MPDERFQVNGETVRDAATGLVWPIQGRLSITGLAWAEAFAFVAVMNRDRAMGFSDWRLPNRRELYSLIDHSASRPALPPGHPFQDVWHGWCWTSTTSARATAYAWWVQMSGGRMFYGRKNEDAAVWPVRGESRSLYATGQNRCYNADGAEIPCQGSGQDGDLRMGLPWPKPRFRETQAGVLDLLTGLEWTREASLAAEPINWAEAHAAVRDLAARTGLAWRLPSIMELESLTDCSRADPALPEAHPFISLHEACWSATTSGFDQEWAFCLYFHKGAVGVGYKPNREFSAWALRPLPKDEQA